MRTRYWIGICGAAFAVAAAVAYFVIPSGGMDLLALKRQLATPQEYFSFQRGDSFAIQLRKPTIQPAALRRIGLAPTVEKVDGESRLWTINMAAKKSDGTDAAAGKVQLRFSKEGLTQIDLPGSVGQFLSDDALYQYLSILGHSDVDFHRRRSVYVPSSDIVVRPLAFPLQVEAAQLFGLPTERLKGKAYAIDTYKLTMEGRKDRPQKQLRTDLAFHPWTGAFKYAQLTVAGFGVLIDEGGIVIKR